LKGIVNSVLRQVFEYNEMFEIQVLIGALQVWKWTAWNNWVIALSPFNFAPMELFMLITRCHKMKHLVPWFGDGFVGAPLLNIFTN